MYSNFISESTAIYKYSIFRFRLERQTKEGSKSRNKAEISFFIIKHFQSVYRTTVRSDHCGYIRLYVLNIDMIIYRKLVCLFQIRNMSLTNELIVCKQENQTRI